MTYRNMNLSQLEDVPQSSVGAPEPLLVSDDHRLSLIFLLQEGEPDWDALSAQDHDWPNNEDHIAIVRFDRAYAHRFGPPSDETIHGHPYASLGLKPYSAFEIKNSDWIETLCDRNRVHDQHDDNLFNNYKHYIFTFHDQMFEVIASGYSVEKVYDCLSTCAAGHGELNRWISSVNAVK